MRSYQSVYYRIRFGQPRNLQRRLINISRRLRVKQFRTVQKVFNQAYLNYYGRYVQQQISFLQQFSLEYLKYLQTEDEKEKQRRRLLAQQDSLPSLDLDYEGILGILHKTEGYKEFCGHRLSLNFQHTTETKFQKLIRFLEDEISIYNSEFLYDSQEIHESLEVDDIDQKSALSFVDNISINDEDDQNTDQLIFDHSSYELEGIQKIILSQKIEETMHFTMVNSILHDNNNQDQEQENDHLNQQGSQTLLGVSSAQEGLIKINPKSRFMIDKFGRSTIFHGVNVVYKIDPYIPTQDAFDPQLSLNDKDIDDLVKWGFNLVRLGVMWEAVERAPGVYDYDYLKKVNDLINKLGQKGIYTMVDAHQDVFARTICGEGMPTFYIPDEKLSHTCPGSAIPWVAQIFGACKSIKDYGFSYDQDGNPNIADCTKNPFPIYYTSPESISAFEMLYKNIDGLQDKFIAYWDVVAEAFAGNQYVIGYDPINEPFPSNFFTDPMLILEPGKFDREVLQPLYKRTYDIYQKHDTSKIMYWEAAEFPDEVGVGSGYVFNLGFTEPPGGADNLETQVLNDHSYCCQLAADMCATGEPPLSKAAECLSWHQKRIGTRADDAKRYQVPLLITEFGACTGSDNCVQEIKAVADTCDQNLVGWAYWEFKKFWDITTSAGSTSEGFYENDGSLQAKKVKALARTYPKATQGVPTIANFDTESGKFEFTYTFDKNVSAPTIIYHSEEYYYQNGFTAEVSDAQGNVIPQEHFTLEQISADIVLNITNQIHDNNQIKVVITPKAQKFIQ